MTAAVNISDLRDALERVFEEPLDGLERRRSPYSSSFALEELEIRLCGGRTLTAIFKNLGPGAMLDQARVVKPASLYDPRREIGVYRSILPSLNTTTPQLYGSIVEPAARHWLFLEHVNGEELYEIGDLDIWLEAARWLARLHAAPSCQPAVARALVPQLLEHDRTYYENWLARARAFSYPRLEPLVEVCRGAIHTLLALPRNLIHGEFYASNILVERRACEARIRPVDWEMAAIGPGILDLAALASGGWSRPQRLLMVEAYSAELPEGLRPPDAVRAFDCARLQNALQWLGWSDDWSPCPQHAFDWLSEAEDACSGLHGVHREGATGS